VMPPQRWLWADAHKEQATELAAAARLPEAVAELLIARGITSPEAALAFLHPDFSQLHEPCDLKGLPEAVDRLEAAIERKEPVLLYGDYDVDGTTAVVLLKTAIEMRGGVARFHVPHRINEGYGLQSSVLEEEFAAGARLVITVDTGMRAFKEADTARRLGLDLIITDHHLLEAGERVPDALAIVNPNLPGCQYPEKFLCGAAIALKLAQALLEKKELVRTRQRILPSFLKMAALATIADAVQLKGENRAIAALGLKELRQPVNPGLRALLAVAELDPTTREISGFDVAFRLAPRINAAGRMDVASEVIELFTTRDHDRARELALKLDGLNRERRETEADALEEIEIRLAQDAQLAEDKLLVIEGAGWHRGVIGILASRVVERTAKPALVISIEDGVAHGSGRSVDGFPLLDALESCAELFTRFGGHAFAVGFSLPEERIEALKHALRRFANEKLAGRIPEQILKIHAELAIDRITPMLVGWLRKMEPFGHGNPEPIFAARRLRVLAAPRIIKERHLRLDLAMESLRPIPRAGSSAAMKAMGWSLAARAEELGIGEGSILDVAYKIRENLHPEFGGIEIEIAGLRLAEE